MRSIIPTVCSLIALGIAPLRAELVTRLVVLKMPSTSAPTVRTAFAENAANPEATEMVLALPGVSEMARFTETDPWRRGIRFLTKDTGRIAYLGESKKTLGVQFVFNDPDTIQGVDEGLSTDIVVPTSTSGYREFENTGNVMIGTLGKWQERACWGDGSATLMLWQHITAQGKPDEGRTMSEGDILAVRVEMLWFKAAAGDIDKVTLSQPATREAALQWLTGRATLVKESGFRIRPGDKAMWQDVRGKYTSVDGRAEVKKEGFTVRTTLAEADDQFRLDLTASVVDAVQIETSTPTLTTTPAHGVWEFVRLDGLKEVSLVACRLTPDVR